MDGNVLEWQNVLSQATDHNRASAQSIYLLVWKQSSLNLSQTTCVTVCRKHDQQAQ